MHNLKDLIGQKFDRLTVMSQGPSTKDARACWWCSCVCGAGVLVVGRELRCNDTRSCGCIHKEELVDRNRKSVGEQHPNWKGGITPQNAQLRNKSIFREWRAHIYERDNFTCQKCGVRGGNLNAHHIEAFASNPELRTTISNGITFCKACHRDFHHQYGNQCDTQQLLKFLR